MTGYTFPQLIDFTRTSAATFVNSSGNIASTAQSRNLLTFTQEFSNAAWSKADTTVTANSTTAPDGTSTADTLVAAATTAAHNIQRSGGGSGSPLSLSVYAKAGTSSFLQFSHGAGPTIFANFNLATGALGTVGAGATAAITSVGNGWYRCSMTFTPGSAFNSAIGMITSATAAYRESWTAAGTETIFIWGAQLEQASSATDYTRNFGGLFPPRFDYDPVTRAPRGLLIEEQRTNLLLRSEEFDDASWTKSNSTVTANSTTSPDGTADADKLVEDTAAASPHYIQQSATTTAATHSFSVFVKAAERSFVLLWNQTINFGRVFNVGNGTVSGTVAGVTQATADITSAGNGWYRCTIYGTCTAAANNFRIYLMTDATTFSYTGDGTSGAFLYGAQLEAGAFATSYIPTVASQVTRSADVAAINAPNFASWFNGTAGTIVASVLIGSKSPSSYGIYAVDDGTTNNAIPAFYTGAAQANSRVGGSNVFTSSSAALSATPGILNIAFAYQNADYASSFNGAAPTTQASGAVPSGLNRLQLGTYSIGQLNGHLRSLRFYPTRLTNAQLQALSA